MDSRRATCIKIVPNIKCCTCWILISYHQEWGNQKELAGGTAILRNELSSFFHFQTKELFLFLIVGFSLLLEERIGWASSRGGTGHKISISPSMSMSLIAKLTVFRAIHTWAWLWTCFSVQAKWTWWWTSTSGVCYCPCLLIISIKENILKMC